MILDVKLKTTNNEELERLIPIDRIITIYDNLTYINDTQFIITEEMIEKILNVIKE